MAEPFSKERQVGRKRGKSSKPWKEARYEIATKRSKGACEAEAFEGCSGRGSQFHHRQRRSHGGPDTPENGLWVCLPCHAFIHANPRLSYERGWMVRGV